MAITVDFMVLHRLLVVVQQTLLRHLWVKFNITQQHFVQRKCKTVAVRAAIYLSC